MDAAIPHLPAETPNAAGSPSLLAAFLRLLRRASQTKAERALAGLIEFGAESIGSELLRAEDLADLEMRIDAATMGDDFASWLRLLQGHVGGAPGTNLPSGDVAWPEEVVDRYGAGNRDLLNQALATLMEIGRATARMHPPISRAGEGTSAQPFIHPGEFLRSDELHPQTSTALFSLFAAQICLLGIVEATRPRVAPNLGSPEASPVSGFATIACI